jgi:hypothetical protein
LVARQVAEAAVREAEGEEVLAVVAPGISSRPAIIS